MDATSKSSLIHPDASQLRLSQATGCNSAQPAARRGGFAPPVGPGTRKQWPCYRLNVLLFHLLRLIRVINMAIVSPKATHEAHLIAIVSPKATHEAYTLAVVSPKATHLASIIDAVLPKATHTVYIIIRVSPRATHDHIFLQLCYTNRRSRKQLNSTLQS